MDNQLLLLGLLVVLLLVNIIVSGVTLSKLNKKDGYAAPGFRKPLIDTSGSNRGSLMNQ